MLERKWGKKPYVWRPPVERMIGMLLRGIFYFGPAGGWIVDVFHLIFLFSQNYQTVIHTQKQSIYNQVLLLQICVCVYKIDFVDF